LDVSTGHPCREWSAFGAKASLRIDRSVLDASSMGGRTGGSSSVGSSDDVNGATACVEAAIAWTEVASVRVSGRNEVGAGGTTQRIMLKSDTMAPFPQGRRGTTSAWSGMGE
jgi:hypothetical protein